MANNNMSFLGFERKPAAIYYRSALNESLPKLKTFFFARQRYYQLSKPFWIHLGLLYKNVL